MVQGATALACWGRSRWPESAGLGGRFPPDWVAALRRNQWPLSAGLLKWRAPAGPRRNRRRLSPCPQPLSGRCRQQQPRSGHRVTTTPLSTKHPQAAHLISILPGYDQGILARGRRQNSPRVHACRQTGTAGPGEVTRSGLRSPCGPARGPGSDGLAARLRSGAALAGPGPAHRGARDRGGRRTRPGRHGRLGRPATRAV